MRSSAAAAWPAFCTSYEGRCTWLYLDTKQLPTTGLGHRVFTVADMVALPWLTPGGLPASDESKRVEWTMTLRRTDLARLGGGAYAAVATLHLSQATVDQLLTDDTPRYWDPLRAVLPDLEGWPADAQLALLDMAYNLGAYFLGPKWPNFTAACKAGDFTAAAAACLRAVKAPRDYRHQRMFANAATVVRLGLDPAVLWLGKTPTPQTAPPVVAPPEEAPPVTVTWKQSSRWGQKYRWWRGGNMTPTGIAVCTAIPSPVVLSQGGLSTGVAASANTHAGLGAYDISVKGWSRGKTNTLAAELIRSGEYAFPRGGLWGTSFFTQHVHVASKNNYGSLHPEAQAQVRDFDHKPRRNGLAGHGKYVGPSTPAGTWDSSPYNPKNLKAPAQKHYRVVVGTLQGLDVDRNPRAGKLRKRGYVVTPGQLVRRWGRWNVRDSDGTYYAVKDAHQTYLEPVVPPAPPEEKLP